MHQDTRHAGNIVLIRGATLWLLMALLLAWCMVGLNFGVAPLKAIFAGKFTRLLSAHLDFLIMSALIFGFYAARVTLPWHVRWAMVVGAFTNSCLFLLSILDSESLPEPKGTTPPGRRKLKYCLSVLEIVNTNCRSGTGQANRGLWSGLFLPDGE